MKTARCYDLYGMFYWNKWMSNKDRGDWLDACLPYYEKQLEITEVSNLPCSIYSINSRKMAFFMYSNTPNEVRASL